MPRKDKNSLLSPIKNAIPIECEVLKQIAVLLICIVLYFIVLKI